ncbi:flagellin [Tabrizicola sp. M-4]|uniref:flagellin N-terminal helical domain-containing protein n=1 Tax=Tabrizicola sp. M-4 TaxID=3055847 RepID=UPI003DA9B282
MSSILTNNGAMVALQTMKNINASLGRTQSEISTGKTVANAKDNAAVWAISKTMEADVEGFKGISDSLSLGTSTIAVARQASETVTDLLKQMKSKIVSAQSQNIDRAKLQTDVAALREQIGSVVKAAQFNGLNLIDGSTASMEVLSSLDRSTSGVAASTITVNGQNLSTGGYTANDVFSGSTGGTISNAADTFVLSLDAAGGSDDITIGDGANAWAAGDSISLRIGDRVASYTVKASDVASANNSVPDLIAVGLKDAIDKLGISDLTVEYDSTNAGQLVFTNNTTRDLSVSGQYQNAGSGGLGAIQSINVQTNPTAALATVESLLSTAIDASSAFGSAQGRIETQAKFVSQLSDALTSGIGTLVDADMEETSARLQALQVQQQLATQALSIANQQPQNLLALFR